MRFTSINLRRIFLSAVIITVIFSSSARAQVTVSGSTGADGNYTSLTQAGGAFAALNATADQTGNTITVTITSDVTTENGAHALSNKGWASLMIVPSGNRTLSGNVTQHLIRLTSTQNVTIDGLNDGINSLTIANLDTGATPGTCTLNLYGDASGNTIQNCTILGSATGAPGNSRTTATILFDAGGTTSGCDNNTVLNNNIGPNGTNFPRIAVASWGPATLNNNNSITGNNIYDYYHTTTATAVNIGSNSSAWTISNNKFYQTGNRSGLAGTGYLKSIYIYTAAGSGYLVSGNTIGYASSAGTGMYTNSGGRFTGIEMTVAASPVSEIQGNTINGIYWTTQSNSSSPGACPFNGINVLAGGVNIGTTTANTIGAATGTGSTSSNIYIVSTATGTGIIPVYLSSATAGTIQNNTIGAITASGAAGIGFTFYGIYTAGAGNHNVLSNTVGNATADNITIGVAGITTTNCYAHGIYSTATGSPAFGGTSAGNIIRNLRCNSSGASQLNGIYAIAGTAVTVAHNLIYNLTGGSGTTVALVNGILLNGGTTVNVSNNLIGSLTAPAGNSADAIRGISITSTNALTTFNIFYNTIYLNATSTATNFGSSGIYHAANPTETTATLNLNNNVIVNNSTAKGTDRTVAYRRSAVALNNYAASSDHNIFYAGTPGSTNFVFYDGTNSDQTLVSYKARVAPRDANSYTENVPFLSTNGADATFLHIDPTVATQVESGAVNITGYTVDFDGETRQGNAGYAGTGFAPDIGADEGEFTRNDITPPVITYTPLQNTILLDARELTVTITDLSGIPTSGAGLPVLYWRINSGSWSSAIAVSLGSNQYRFTFGAGVVAGDQVWYYVAAQDSFTPVPNVTCYPLTGAGSFTYDPPAAGTPPTTPSYYWIGFGLSGTVTVGSGGTYPNLTGPAGLFRAIRNDVLVGDFTASIISDLTEDGTYSLLPWVEGGTGNYTFRIQPDASTLRTISGTAVATATPMIHIEGADRVIIDGTAGKYLTFRNTNATAANTGPTIQFNAGSVNCTLQYCTIENNGSSTLRGALTIGSTGTNTVTIDHNDIRDATAGTTGTPAYGIYSNSTGNTITVTGNNIFNWTSAGIYLNAIADGCTVSGNSLYQTASRTTALTGIYITSGNGHTVSGNYIGGSAPLCGGGPMTKTSTTNSLFYGIYLNVGTLTACSVQNNTIQNISWGNSSNAFWYGIYLAAGSADIGTVAGNTIGSGTGTGSITVTCGATNTYTFGICLFSSSAVNCQNNVIGSLTVTGGPTLAHHFYGIYTAGGGTFTVNNNTIGSLTTPGSITSGSTSTLIAQNVYGVYNLGSVTVTISGNTIANLVNSTTNTTPATAGLINGITSTNGTNSITGNTIRDLTIANANNTTINTASAGGIVLTGNSLKTVSGNTIYNISNTYTAFAGNVTGIYFTGSTGANMVSGNLIHSLSVNSSSTQASVYGIRIASGATTCANNIITLGGNTATTLYGIYEYGVNTSNNNNLYFNTVYIGGSLGAGITNKSYAVYSAASTNVRNFRNNIFVNARSTTGGSSLHYAAYFNYAVNTNLTLDYNDYYASGTGGVPGYYNSSNVLTLPLVPTKDTYSQMVDPLFANAGGTAATDYIPASGQLIGCVGSGIVTDYSGAARIGTPTMGAWEGSLLYNVEIYKTGVLQARCIQLFDAFYSINRGLVTGDLEVRILGSTTETGTAVLYQSGYTGAGGTSSYTSIAVFPTVTGLTVSSNLAAPLIDLDGADNVTFDGRVNGTGAAKDLSLINTSTSNTAGTSTIRFINDASGNTVKYCIIKGSETNTTSGVIFFSTAAATTTGNDNNTLDNNDITCAADANRPINAIYSLGTAARDNSGNAISNNNIFDFLNRGVSSSGIFLSSNTTEWVISGNSFYETASFTSTLLAAYYVIRINNTSGSGYTVNGNFIGGNGALCSGSPWTKTNASDNSFDAININAGTAIETNIQGNTIQNISWSSNTNAAWYGIDILAGNVNIGTTAGNTIGSGTGTGSITISGGHVGTWNMNVYGIYIATPGSVVCKDNTIGSITVANENANLASNFYGIYKTAVAGATTINNNLIGSTTSAHSINATSTSSSNTQYVYGIYSLGTGGITINGNTIANLTNGTTNPTFGQGQVGGLYFAGGTVPNVVSRNFIHSLSVNPSSTAADIFGIRINSGATTYDNNIINLGGNSATTLYGIYETGSSGHNNNLWFNTVYIGGSLGSGVTNRSYALYSAAASNVRNFRNNLLINARSTDGGASLHYAAYFNYGINTNLTLDYNDYYVSGTGGMPGYYAGDKNVLPIVTGNDASSLIVDPGFANPGGTSATDYVPSNNQIAGVPIAGITADYAGTPRAGTPTMGAFEGMLAFNVEVYKAGVLQTKCSRLKDAFHVINNGTVTGALEIRITGSTTETASAILYQSGYTGAGGTSNYSSVAVYPTVSGLSVTGNMAVPLIDLNGADNVTIDGRVNATGTGKDLAITNTSTSATAGASTIRIMGDATSNTVEYCIISGSTTGAPGTTTRTGTLLFGAGGASTGCDNNTVQNNDIGPNGTAFPTMAIASWGPATWLNDNNTITGNNIYDFYGGASLSAAAINIGSNSSGWTISNNRFYQTGSRTGLGNTSYLKAIYISTTTSGGYNVTGNIIGYASSGGTGMLTNSGGLFTGIEMTVAATPVSNVQGNEINGIWWTTANGASTPGSCPFNGINILEGGVNVGTITGNVIGATSGTGSSSSNIYVSSTTSGTGIIPIYLSSSTACTIQNNAVGAIAAGGEASIGFTLSGIYLSGTGNHTVISNTVGNPTPDNISLGITGTTSADCNLTGIFSGGSGQVTIGSAGAGNRIRNLSHKSSGSGTVQAIVNSFVKSVSGITSISYNSVDSLNFNAASTSASCHLIRNSNSTATSSVIISNNTFGPYSANYTGSTGGLTGASFTGIHQEGTCLNSTISNNTFNNLNLNTAGAVYIFNHAFTIPENGTKTFSNNTINGFSRTSVSGNAFYCYYNYGASPNSSVHEISGNNFTNISCIIGSSWTFSGFCSIDFYNSNPSDIRNPSLNVYNNTLSDVSITIPAGQHGYVYGYQLNGFNGTIGSPNRVYGNTFSGSVISGEVSFCGMTIGGNFPLNEGEGQNFFYLDIYNNTIENHSHINGLSNSTNDFDGFRIFNGLGSNIYSNIIRDLSSSTAYSVNAMIVWEIETVNIYRNNISNISNNNSSNIYNPLVNGMLFKRRSNANVWNNLIGNLTAPSANYSDAIRGISMPSSVISTFNIYYNSVYIAATSTGTNFGTSGIYHVSSGTSSEAALDLRNNIIVNNSVPNGTGRTVAYRRSDVSLTNYMTASDNNILYAGTPGPSNLIMYDGTNSYQTLTSFKGWVAPREASSMTENVPFLSTNGSDGTFLHINPSIFSQVESGAVNIAAYTDDFDGDIRQGNAGYTGTGGAPDVGADEGNFYQGVDVYNGAIYLASYSTLKAAFDKINDGTHSGALDIRIAGSIVETAPAVLYQSGYTGAGGISNYSSVHIYPCLLGSSVTGNLSAPLIDLDGADQVTIDGRMNAAGTEKVLELINYSTAGSDITSAIRFINDASGNTVKYCTVSGSGTGASGGVILFSTTSGSTGNNGNTLDNNDITCSDDASRPVNAIFSSGSSSLDNSGNVISNNNIYNFLNRGIASNGIHLSSNSTAWTISGNSFYETASFVSAADVSYSLIKIDNGSGNNFTVSGNYIGGTAPVCGGTAWTKTGASNNPFSAIFVNSGTIGGSSIQGNTIQNFSWSNSADAAWSGIQVTGGEANIGTVSGNSIGADTGPVSVLVTGGATGSVVRGIHIETSGTAVCRNNTIGSVTASNAAGNASNIYGISNTGTGDATIGSNVVSNLLNSSSHPSLGVTAGIDFNGGTGNNTVAGNFIHSLDFTNPSSGGSIFGIRITSGLTTYYNNLITLGGNSGVTIFGIYESGAAGNDNHLYFNTVYIDGSPGAGVTARSYALYSESSANIRDFRNNLFVNERSTSGGVDLHYAAWFNYGGASNLTLDYNDYLATGTGGVLGYYNSSNVTALPLIAGQDAHSLSVDPGFALAGGTSANDYVPGAIVRAGISIGGITTDYLLKARGIPPTIGAFEVPFNVEVWIASVKVAEYITLKEAFDNINSGIHAGIIEIRIKGSTNESSTAVLYQSGYTGAGGTSAYSSVRIYPVSSGYSIAGSLAAPLIDLNGADDVTIDGRVNGEGSAKAMSIVNRSSDASAMTSAIRFINDATGNEVKYCFIKGSGTGSSGGVVFFSTTTGSTGNDNNLIDNNDITCSADASRPVNALFSSGTPSMDNNGMVISNNHIFNSLNRGIASNGVHISSNNTAWTISGNSFYESGSFAPTANVSYNVIRIDNATGNDFTVTGNFIGGTEALCGGSAWVKTAAANNLFNAIYVNSGTSGGSSIQGNTISNFSWSNNDATTWTGIYIAGGNTDVGNIAGNTIGSATGTGSIQVIFGGPENGMLGIYSSGAGAFNCQNNVIGSVTVSNSNSDYDGEFIGIYKINEGTANISNNLIGGSTANSVLASSPCSNYYQFVIGVYSISSSVDYPVVIEGNTIQNLTNATTNPQTFYPGFINGIKTSGGKNTIINNTVRDLTIANANSSGSTAAVVGISVEYASAAEQFVAGNTIFNLSNTHTNFTGYVVGLGYSGSTTQSYVSNNFIHSLSVNAASTAATISGIRIYTGAATYFNNIITLNGNTATTLYGIYETGSAGNNNNLYFNTVYIAGSLATGVTRRSYALYSASSANTRDFRDNLFINERSTADGTNLHYAAWFNYGTASNLTLDYNDYRATGTGGMLGYFNGSNVAALPLVTGQDGHSISLDPVFILPGGTQATDYIPGPVVAAGTTISGIVTDYFSEVRPGTPTMGAIETPLPPVEVWIAGSKVANYGLLKTAFDKINDGTHTGAIEIKITDNITEIAPAILYQSGYTGAGGTSAYSSVTIYPTKTTLSVSGDLASPLIDLDGADNVVIDGRVNASGSSADLVITNSNNSGTAGTSAIRFINDASGNTVRYCSIKASGINTSSGIILFSTTTGSTGNDNNTIEYNDITSSADANRPINAIYSLGTAANDNSGNTISNNNIFNFLNREAASNGIYLYSNNTAWTISANSFYETTTFSPEADAEYNIIRINNSSGTGFSISDNSVGGSASSCSGSAWTKTDAYNNGFYAISVIAGDVSIQGNTIRNFLWSNAGSSEWYGMYIFQGNALIGTVSGNSIGDVAGTGSVAVNFGDAFSSLIGIFSESDGDFDCRNNIIGSVTAGNTDNTADVSFFGIYLTGSGESSLINNTIGSNTSNSINITSASTSNPQFVVGIMAEGIAGEINISGNTIANMTNGTTMTDLFSPGLINGIKCTDGIFSITDNVIHNLTISSANIIPGEYSSVAGIVLGTNSQFMVSGNSVYDLSNSYSTFAGSINGLFISSGTYDNLVTNNFIHSLSATGGSSTGATIYGMNISSGGVTCFNNIITLGGNSASKIYGMYESGSAAYSNSIYFNTVYIGGSLGSGATNPSYGLYSNGTTTIRNFRDNLFINERSTSGGTNLHYAAWFNYGSTTNLTLNYNDYLATGTGGVLGYFNGTNVTSLPLVPGQDANSLTVDPAFALPGGTTAMDYLPYGTITVGISIGGITTDYASTPRPGTPTIGALEAPLLPAEIWISGVKVANYINLKAAFDKINNGTHTGAMEIKIAGSTIESAPAVLYHSGYTSGKGTSSYPSITIFPTETGLSVSGNLAGPLIELNGADNVIIDGRVNASGSSRDLTIVNSSNASVSNIATIAFVNDASSNTVRYCTVKGSGTNPTGVVKSGVIHFGPTTVNTGNDNNTIDNNNITCSSDANRPEHAIYSGQWHNFFDGDPIHQNSGNTISNNDIYDFLNRSIQSDGIYIQYQSTDWTISGNSLYETTPFTPTDDLWYCAIRIDGDYLATDFNVTGNYIGGSAPLCGGSPWTKTSAFTSEFEGINVIMYGTNQSSIQGNTIANFSWNNASSDYWFCGIDALYGNQDVGTITGNVIGSASGTGSISVTSTGSGYADLVGIYYEARWDDDGTTFNCQNNTIGSLTHGNTEANGNADIVGIWVYPGNADISNNTIGSLTTGNSINASSACLAGSQYVIGIWADAYLDPGTVTISGNTIDHLTNGTTKPNPDGIGFINGIRAGSFVHTITGNSVRNLTIANGNAFDNDEASVSGITIYQNSLNTVTGNTIQNLSNTYTTFTGSVVGLYYSADNGSNEVSGNFIHSLSVDPSSTDANLYGIRIVSGTTTFANNIIYMGGSTPVTLYGIYESGVTGEENSIWFNTVYLNGSLAAGTTNPSYAFYSENASTTRNIRDNLFVNERSTSGGASLHYAAWFNYGVSTLLTLDYNDYYVTGVGGMQGHYNGADVTTLPLVPGNDAHSLMVDPGFANPGSTVPIDYVPGGSVVAGITITGIDTDFVGTLRAATPTMGALEGLGCSVDITVCPVPRTFAECGTGDITNPPFSPTAASTTLAVFTGAPNNGVVASNCGLTGIEYIDVASGSCPVTVQRTWTLTDATGIFASCVQTLTLGTPPVAAFAATSNISIECGDAPPAATALLYTNGATGACLITGFVTGVIAGSHDGTGGLYTESWSYTDLCSRTITASRTITVLPIPAPDPVSGDHDPCAITETVYSVTDIPGVTFTWTVPPGSIIKSGQGTNSITVVIGTQPGGVCVTATEGSCTSTPTCLSVVIQTVFPRPVFE